MKSWITYLLPLFTVISLGLKGQVLMHPNRGQWEDPIDYLVEMDAGYLYLESQGLTYNLFESHSHQASSDEHYHADESIIKQHVVKTHFVGSQIPSDIIEQKKQDYYRNYFLGNDSSRWKSKIHSIQEVDYLNIYPNIHLNYTANDAGLKYSFTLLPFTDAAVIATEIVGAEKIEIDKNGALRIKTRFGWIQESKPVAWIVNEDGLKSFVDCEFIIKNNIVSFKLGAYDISQTLVIDPQLTFSTFTGATSDNWGYTACPDEIGNLFAGGNVFGAGYPVTTGSFDVSFNGGNPTGGIPGFDITITKFNALGNLNLFSTFIGGSGNETPNSMVTNTAGDLFILSTTSSPNFPVSIGAFQPSFAGGTSTIQTLLFNGSDLAIARLSADGTTLQGSTYLGGTANDGLNYGSNLKYNYGDAYRGEIIVDENSNVYFSSSTQSINFPVAINSGGLQGAQDAIYGKLNPTLSNLEFCHYFGGTGFETGNSIQLSQLNELYLTGGSTSSLLAFANGGFQTTQIGGADTYVIRTSALTGTVLNGTYLGTAAYDQGYFVQVDLDNNIYVLGQTRGSYPNTALFGIPNSGQFIHKLSQDLSTSLWSTTIGAGSGNNEISPTAFLVSDCFDIYLSGWGGLINSVNSLATQSSSNGFPLTPDAYQSATNGSNFYIAVLARDSESLKYGTYMGGLASSFNHVDGGSSRFYKDGTIYHAVCGSCGISTTGFTVTPGVWSPTDLSNNCNLAAFKFNLNTMTATIGNTDQFICFPDPVIFQNLSSFGNKYHWDFGDGSTSEEVNPSHDYSFPGTYVVQLIVMDTNDCYFSDTSYFDIVINEFEGAVTPIMTPVCPNIPFQLEASGGYQYRWSPGSFLDDSTSATPMATITQATTFQVIVIDSCGIDTLSVFVDVYAPSIAIFVDTSLCIGDSIPISIDSTNIQSISWQPVSFFLNGTSFNTQVFISSSQTITANIITSDGCLLSVTQFIHVDTIIPTISISDSTICEGQVINLISTVDALSGTYSWIGYPEIGPNLNAISPVANTLYTVVYQLNSCFSSDSAIVFVSPQPWALNLLDTTICFGQTVSIVAQPDILGGTFLWPFNNSTSNTLAISPIVGNHSYELLYSLNGCSVSDTSHVEVLPQPTTLNLIDQTICDGESVTLNSIPDILGGLYNWMPTNESTQSIIVTPSAGENYYFIEYDVAGCTIFDSVLVYVNPQPSSLLFNDTTICFGANVTILAQSDISGGTYQWVYNSTIGNSLTSVPAIGVSYFPVTYSLNNCTVTDSAMVNVLPQPTTLNLVNYIVCEDSVLTLSANPTLLGGTYLWSHSGETNATVTINSVAGISYFPILYDLNGCVFEDSILVIVNTYPLLTHSNYFICEGDNVQIGITTSLPNGTFLWNNSNEITPTIVVSPLMNSLYPVRYTVNGCATNSVVSVGVNPLPTGTILSNNACQNDLIHTEVQLNTTLNVNFQWFVNGVGVLGATSNILDSAFIMEGFYNLNVIATSESGCVATYLVNSIVYPNPLADFNFSIACLNETANFNDASTVSNQNTFNTITDWNWTFPLNNSSTVQNPTFNFTASGNDVVSLEVITNNGCLGDTTISLYVEPIPLVGFNITEIEGCSPVCFALSAFAETDSDLAISTYHWQFSNGVSQISSSPNFSDCFETTSDAQYIDAILTVESLNGCSESFSANSLISVYPNAVANFSITPENPSVLDNYIRINNYSGNSSIWEWQTSFDGTSNIQNPVFVNSDQPGSQSITLISNNQYDCPDTIGISFEVVDVNLVYVPNTFTPDGGTFNSVFIPVFSDDFLPTNYHFLIFNRWGEVVFETTDPLIGWNGSYLGKIAQDGTYTWKIEYRTVILPEDKQLVGHVNLLR